MEAFYKLAYDISCYYAFAAFFLCYVAEYKVNPLSFLAFFAVCFGAVYAEKAKRFSQAVQIGAFLLPVIPLILETNLWGKLVLILPWIYLMVTVLRQGYDISYRRFKRTYLCFFWIYSCLFLFFVLEEPVMGEVAIVVTAPYLLILLVAGSFLLQMLRYQPGSADKKKLEKYQYRQMIILMVTAIVVTVGNVVEWLYVYVFYPLTKLVLGAMTALAVYVVGELDKPLQPPKEIGDMGKGVSDFAEKMEEINENRETLWGKVPEKVQAVEAKEMNWTPVIIIFTVLAAIVILAVMFGSKSKKVKQADIEDEREEFHDEITAEKALRKHFVRPEIIIRFYYREFMKKSETKKHKLEDSDTTKEIFAKYQTWNDATPEQKMKAEEITALYQKTRYSKAKITHTDANRMKALVKKL